ncbi:MAG: hypothetical protein QXI16_03680 [Sulfolobaceae archaeon]
MAKKHGGARKGAGRKPKADEIKLIERLDNIIDSDEVIRKLNELIKDGNYQAIRTYLEYRYGKPKNNIDITSGNEVIPNFNLSHLTEKELSIILKLYERPSTDSNEEGS